MITKLLGFIGGVCFAACGVPAALATFKAKKSIGTPISVALYIFSGAIAMYFYLLLTYGFDLLLTANYLVEAGSWGLIAYYHFFPRQ